MHMYVLEAGYMLGVMEIKEQLVVMSEEELDPADTEDEVIDAAVGELVERFNARYNLDLEIDDLTWSWWEIGGPSDWDCLLDCQSRILDRQRCDRRDPIPYPGSTWVRIPPVTSQRPQWRSGRRGRRYGTVRSDERRGTRLG
jgi:hypothetical protein